ncbi:hypothetical protein DFJ73DRAFT_588361 [Zopfochytrium polystomum]|nr:hypothetical protein DFJ73DRAFT_588361 [Zopfochytrium polystomum]
MLQAGSAGAAPAGHGGIALLGVGGGGVDGVTAPSTATTRGSDGGDGNGVEGPGIPSIERSERSEQSRTAADTNPPPASPPRPPPVLRILHDIWSFLNGPNPLRPPSIRPLPNIGAIDMFLHYRVLTKIPLSIRLVALIVYLTLWGYGFGTLVNMSNSTPATSYSDSPTVIGSTVGILAF